MPTDATAGFGTTQLFLADSRLVLAVLNHLRYQALNRAFGVSREQANVLTAVLLLGAADGAYEATRRMTGMGLHISGTDAALGAAGRPEDARRRAAAACRRGAGAPRAHRALRGRARSRAGERAVDRGTCRPAR